MYEDRIFATSNALQSYLLQEVGPHTLVLVPHRRLARQLWHRQRLTNLERRLSAWEPLPLMTLPDWWAEIFRHLWSPYAPAPPLVRLALWRQAIAAGPLLEGTGPDLDWAQALDEASELLQRHGLPVEEAGPGEPPLVRWRREVSRIYGELLRENGWLAPAEVPAVLLDALDKNKIPLPAKLLVVGLETPAPLEQRWFEAVSRRLPVIRLLIRGDPAALQNGHEFPEVEEEMAWVGAQILASHLHERVPLHRLAVTSPSLDRYITRLQKLFHELLGPAVQEDGGVYNFSQGPRLAEAPLCQAAFLPLAFLAQGERREDLVALFLSPYYQTLKPHQPFLSACDRHFREKGAAHGWEHLKAAALQGFPDIPAVQEVMALLEEIWPHSGVGAARGKDWLAWLQSAWKALGFAAVLEGPEVSQFERLGRVWEDFTVALGRESLTAAEVLSWLHHAVMHEILPGPGLEEAGVQILGWLEIRGLDFDRVFCLGMNSAAFPGSPRPLPLLSRMERQQILGGTQESQDRFAREMFETLLGTAPRLIFTRPAFENQEPQVPTPFFLRDWEPARMPLLSRPDPAWASVSAVRAALAHPEGAGPPEELQGRVALALPEELRVTQLGKALGCRLRFVLEDLWGIRELPEIEAGLDPRERGAKLHQILARFAVLVDYELPPEEEALAVLEQAARQVLGSALEDVHWQAEWRRWFGDPGTPGLLPAWLALERDRQAQGWRWLGAEVAFEGLTRPGWPFTLRGRLDRLDFHPSTGELLVWDYKTGAIPNRAQIFARGEEFQLPAYLLAVREERAGVKMDQAARFSAGFISLKSTRADHLQHQDYPQNKDLWPEIIKSWEEEVRRLGELLQAGDLRPAPRPVPTPKNDGACAYCPFSLLCGYQFDQGNGEEDA
ncbi:MAG: PD-(D/E)XK nuclease family protein [Desulfobaccales bacterium]